MNKMAWFIPCHFCFKENRYIMSEYDVQIEKCLKTFIDKKMQKHKLKTQFPNELLREDVLDLLDMFSTVVYYPLDDNNCGFHTKNMPLKKSQDKDFVYINTAKTKDEQNFTAAHELGHIWEADNYVISELGLDADDTQKEAIINRFAAILLMPEDSFKKIAFEGLGKLVKDSNKILLDDFIKLCVILMNHFFTTYKSVVNRFIELGILLTENSDSLKKDSIVKHINFYINELGYTKLSKKDERKWINGLPELLNTAERNKLVPASKVEALRKAFELEPPVDIEPQDQYLPLKTQEGANDNDN